MTDLLNSSQWQLIVFFGILLLTVILGSIFRKFAARHFLSSIAQMKRDITRYKFIVNLTTAMIYLVGIGMAIYVIPSLRTVANSMLAGAGLFALAVGFAAKDALSNLIAGVFIVIFRPFSIGDRVKIQMHNGVVEDITLRHTVIRNFENQRIVMPNSIISTEYILNADLNDSRICKWIDMGISYGSDIDLARKIIREEIMAHPLLIDGRDEEQIANGDPQVPIRVIMLGDFAVTLRAWAWTPSPQDAKQLEWDVTESIKKRFDREGVEIPFPYRTVVYKNDLPNEATLNGPDADAKGGGDDSVM